MRFDPLRELDRLTQQAGGNAGDPSSCPCRWMATGKADEFVVHFDLPGIDAHSIDLTVEKNVPTVGAARPWRRGEGQELIVAERPQGTPASCSLATDSMPTVAASYDNGVLTVRLPVAEQAKPRKAETTGGNDRCQAIDANTTTEPTS